MRKFSFTLASGTKLTIHPPTVRQYYVLKSASDPKLIVRTATEIMGKMPETIDELKCFIKEYLTEVEMIINNNQQLQIPYAPVEKNYEPHFRCNTEKLKLVIDYTGLNINEVWELNYFEYRGYLHDAFVWERYGSKQGREYLENAYYYQQTEPDRTGLRRVLSGGK